MAVRAIRGAVTADSNTKDEILNKTRNLIEEIITKNGIENEDIISIFFTTTSDLNAVFPAVAARQIGLVDVALMCSNEIDVPGSLRMCIRLMMHVNTDKLNSEIQNVYLGDAQKLRPDLNNE